jgi:hypothetical protein
MISILIYRNNLFNRISTNRAFFFLKFSLTFITTKIMSARNKYTVFLVLNTNIAKVIDFNIDLINRILIKIIIF